MDLPIIRMPVTAEAFKSFRSRYDRGVDSISTGSVNGVRLFDLVEGGC